MDQVKRVGNAAKSRTKYAVEKHVLKFKVQVGPVLSTKVGELFAMMTDATKDITPECKTDLASLEPLIPILFTKDAELTKPIMELVETMKEAAFDVVANMKDAVEKASGGGSMKMLQLAGTLKDRFDHITFGPWPIGNCCDDALDKCWFLLVAKYALRFSAMQLPWNGFRQCVVNVGVSPVLILLSDLAVLATKGLAKLAELDAFLENETANLATDMTWYWVGPKHMLHVPAGQFIMLTSLGDWGHMLSIPMVSKDTKLSPDVQALIVKYHREHLAAKADKNPWAKLLAPYNAMFGGET